MRLVSAIMGGKVESKEVGKELFCKQGADATNWPCWETLKYITKEQENDSSDSNLGTCSQLEFSLPEAAFHINESSYIWN